MIIYKYRLDQDPDKVQSISLPYNHKILQAGEQSGQLFVWVSIDNEDNPIDKRFYIIGTGNHNIHILPNDINRLQYLNTVQMTIGHYAGLVWHVYYV